MSSEKRATTELVQTRREESAGYPLSARRPARIRPSSSCSPLQRLSGEAQVPQVPSCTAPVPAGSQVGLPRRPTCNRSSDGAPGSRVQRVQGQRYCGCMDTTPAPLPPPGTLAWACSVQWPRTSCAGAGRQPSRHPSSFVVVPSVHTHARRTQHLAKATAATHPNPDANPRRSQAHDNTYLSYSRNAIISTVAGGALVRQHAPNP